ncbi:TIM barrel protein [Candidatus Woesearchaeota archaeon]|jgi:deoxyribonuclease IV|nr:TIM barrel protein [Candidatus Woesearchaeota archaeon]MBT4110976.1 TIM barrel protein [Candidatus Woesearchaeota archaeon]MBT4336845.1 TIM barrel protein [Candidatus Woesearchaeota archaeon]MBT4469840.1 TIM barrel protein [Candidatus Woesearchaeota archaeon]MBT6743689.1 TIM barrel protein [Candidatus Woesearchaeota archaeon]
MKKLLFGTAGIPISTPDRNTLNGVEHVRTLGLDCMELEFVHSVNISKEKAPLIKAAAEKHNVFLTCHGQYFINLSSLEVEKIEASKQRILNAARIANLCGAKSMTFHAGFYMKQDPEEVYQKIKKGVKEVVEILKKEKNPILIRPETTGKATQWGTVEEIVRLSKEVDQVLPCIDFSHVYARSIGKINSLDDFRQILKLIEKELGRKVLDNMHIHLSGIYHGEKGERHHLTLKESDFNYSAVLKALKEFDCKGIVISESPVIEKDALLLQKEFNSL